MLPNRRAGDHCSRALVPAKLRVVVRASFAALVVGLVIGAWPAAARADEPSRERLLWVGAALAPPTYLLGVAIHEGSHALAAELVGGDVIDVHVFPPGRDPRSKSFRFGWTYVRGLRGKSDRLWFFAAPKIADVALLGGFAALAFTDAWPDNRYGALALTVVATGLWVDFAKDVLAFRATNDVVKMFDLWCMRGWRQIPARLVYATAVAGLGVVVARGYERTFERSGPTAFESRRAAILPVLSGHF